MQSEQKNNIGTILVVFWLWNTSELHIILCQKADKYFNVTSLHVTTAPEIPLIRRDTSMYLDFWLT